ncbi:MAG: endonuclease/exonuclease/phosphatase family protein [Candidatus Kapaibacterium sp.]
MSLTFILSLFGCLPLIATYILLAMRQSWWEVLLVQYKPHLALTYFICTVFFALSGFVLYALFPLLLFLYFSAPYFAKIRWSRGHRTEVVGSDNQLRIFFANVNASNRKVDRVIEAIKQTSPNLLILIECSPELHTLLTEGMEDTLLPHRSYHIYRGERFGVMLWSQFPLEDVVKRTDESHPNQASLVATLSHHSQTIRLIIAHPLSPERPWWVEPRREYVLNTADEARLSEVGGVIVVGDLNATPWDPLFSDLLKVSGLHDARRGFGYVGTWPTLFPPMLIPLDHLLVSDDIEVTNFRRGKRIGSDHWPLEVALTLMKFKSEEEKATI